MLPKLKGIQHDVVVALLGDEYLIHQIGTKPGNLLKRESEIENPHPDIATVGVRTIGALKRNKLIEIKRRQRWYKWWGPTEKAQNLYLSLYNTQNCQIK